MNPGISRKSSRSGPDWIATPDRCAPFASWAQFLLEMISPDRAPDGLVGLRRRSFFAHEPVSGIAIECERGLLQFRCTERQHERSCFTTNMFGVIEHRPRQSALAERSRDIHAA